MKLLFTAACLLASSYAVVAQPTVQSSETPQLAVVKYSWNKERVGWERDPFSGPIENFDEMRVRARNEKRILDAKRGGNSSEVNRAERDARSDQALISEIHKNTPARYGFIYKTSIRNDGNKTVKVIDWDYVFYDLATQNELGRRKFSSFERIQPGKTKELKFFIPGPPTRTISVHTLNKNERSNLGETIVVVRVEYDDGSVWQHPESGNR
jgi:hypothetical protein